MLKSFVWKYFTKTAEKEAQCLICLKKVKTGGGTTNMHHHLRNRHPKYQKSATAAGGESKKEGNIPLEPTVEIKKEHIDYHLTLSTSADTANEEFLLSHEENSWSPPVQPPPNPVVEPEFTLSVAGLASHNNPETSTSNSEQVGNKRKTRASTFVDEPQFTFSVASLSCANAPETSGDEQLEKKRKTNQSTMTTLVPSTNPSGMTLQNPVRSTGESTCPSCSKEPRKDQLDSFGDYIISKLRSLDWRSNTFAQKAIVDVIFEAEMGNFLKEDHEYKVLKYRAS